MARSYKAGDEPVPGFRLASLLARGKFSTIWKANGPGGTDAALKILKLANTQAVKEFRSLRLLKRIRHPNLVPILAFWLKDSQGGFLDEGLLEEPCAPGKSPVKHRDVELIIAMGLGDKSLADRLQECQQAGLPGLPVDELLDFLADAARAIDHLNRPIHDLGSGPIAIQHCDIKPQNILIVSNAAQVCDLGIARVVGDPASTDLMGSAAYLPPEILSKSLPSAASDQYSLAISYYELRSGRLPFDAASTAGAYFAHLQGKLNFGEVPEPERAVLARATCLEPDERYPSCSSMVHALRQACGRIDGSGIGRCADAATESQPQALPRASNPLWGSQARIEEEELQLDLVPDGLPASEVECDTALETRDGSDLAHPRSDGGHVVPRKRRRRSRLVTLAVLLIASSIGPLAAWFTRGSSEEPKGESGFATAQAEIPEAAAAGETPRAVAQLPAREVQVSLRTPFVTESQSRAFASLREALAAAHDGDTITIHGNGPFVTEPLELRGKALTIKAAKGTRPVFQYATRSAERAWQPMLTSDRSLALEGLELRRDGFGVSAVPQGSAPVLVCERAPLRLLGCRIIVPRGSGAIVCRAPRTVEMTNCMLVAYALALFVEPDQASSCSIRLSGSSIDIANPEGAALCICAPPDKGHEGNVRLVLEGNVVRSGRLAGFQGLARGIDFEADGNEFTFHEALLSFRQIPVRTRWQHIAAWRGRGNRYYGTADWVEVDGVPAGIHGLQNWQALWGSPEPDSLEAPSYPANVSRWEPSGLAAARGPDPALPPDYRYVAPR